MLASPAAMPDLLALSFLISAVVACIAGMVRGFAGFGAAMLMTPVFSALYGPAVGIALCLLLEIAVALPLLPAVVRLVDWRRIGLLLVAAVVGVPLGNLVLTLADPEPMRWAISAIVLTAVALLASGWRFPAGRARSRLWPPAPPAAFSTACRAWPVRRSPSTTSPVTKRRRACGPTSRPISSSSTWWRSLVFASRGLIGWDTGVHGLVLAPAVMLGGVLGERLFPLASERFYRRLALVLLVGVAIGSLML